MHRSPLKKKLNKIGVSAGQSITIIGFYLINVAVTGRYRMRKNQRRHPGLTARGNIADLPKYERAVDAFPFMGRLLILINKETDYGGFGFISCLGNGPA